MQDTSEQITAGKKFVFSRCDICEREYWDDEMKQKNAMGDTTLFTLDFLIWFINVTIL